MTVEVLRQTAPQPERERNRENCYKCQSMSSLAESLTALAAVVSRPVAFREGVDVLQSPDSLSRHSEGHFLDAEENVSLELGDWLNASKGPWNLKASGKDGCQADLTYQFLWSEVIFFMAYHMSLRPLLCIL